MDSATKRQIKRNKKLRVPSIGAQKLERPIFFNHLVTGVRRKPRKLASTIGRKRSAATFRTKKQAKTNKPITATANQRLTKFFSSSSGSESKPSFGWVG